MRYSEADIWCGFLNALKPSQGATLQAARTLFLVFAAVHAALLGLFHQILPRDPAA